MNYDRAQLKAEVRQAAKATTPRPMWITLLYSVIVGVGSWLLSLIVRAVSGTASLNGQLASNFGRLLESGYDPQEALGELLYAYGGQLGSLIAAVCVSGLLLSALTALWTGLMGVGYQNYCRQVIHLDQPKMGVIFSGFPMIGKAVLTRFLVWVFTALWTLLFGACFAVVIIVAMLFVQKAAAVTVILILLGYIAFLLMEFWVTLRYALVNYAMLDTGCYGLDALTASKTLMKGNKGKLFVLYLSFIGWYLLEIAILAVAGGISAVLVAGAAGNIVSSAVSYGALAGIMGGIFIVWALAGVGVLLLNIWLQPYVTGCVAKFYYVLKGEQGPEAVQPDVLM